MSTKRVSDKRRREIASPEGQAYEAMLIETDRPWCWACGRDETQRPDGWFLKWELHRAHVAAGGSKMRRVLHRAAAVILCPWCHVCHSTNGAGLNMVCGVATPQLSNANVLFLKRLRDPDFWEPDWLEQRWVGILPDLVPPHAWYLEQYAKRRPADPTRLITAL